MEFPLAVSMRFVVVFFTVVSYFKLANLAPHIQYIIMQ